MSLCWACLLSDRRCGGAQSSAPAARAGESLATSRPSCLVGAPGGGVGRFSSGRACTGRRCARLQFVRGGGMRWYGAVDIVSGELRFSFQIRDSADEQPRFKLIPRSGENVWWQNAATFVSRRLGVGIDQRRQYVRLGSSGRRGAAQSRPGVRDHGRRGGAGTLWIDDLVLEPLPTAEAVPPRPVARSSSFRTRQQAAFAIDGDRSSFWLSARGDDKPWLALDLGSEREIGGLVVEWFPGRHPRDYAVEISADGRRVGAVSHRSQRQGGRDICTSGDRGRHMRLERSLAGAGEIAFSTSRSPRDVGADARGVDPDDRGGSPRGATALDIGEQAYVRWSRGGARKSVARRRWRARDGKAASRRAVSWVDRSS